MSYLNDDYSYDNEYDTHLIKDFLYTTDANKLDDIDKIRDREMRLLKKINNLSPSKTEFIDYYKKEKCRPSMYSRLGGYIEQNRMEKRNNIEDYYYSGYDVPDIYKTGREFDLNQTQPTKSDPRQFAIESFKQPTIRSKIPYQQQLQQSDDIAYLQNELDMYERQNNIYVFFIFLLFIVIIMQYNKFNIDHIKQASGSISKNFNKVDDNKPVPLE